MVFTPMMNSSQFRDTKRLKVSHKQEWPTHGVFHCTCLADIPHMLTQWKLHGRHERPEASQDIGELGIQFKDSSFVCEMLHKGSCS